jgi:hypothetical protein
VPAHPELVVALHQHLSTFRGRLRGPPFRQPDRPRGKAPRWAVRSPGLLRRDIQGAASGASGGLHTRARGLSVGSAPIRPAPCLPVHLAGGWSPAHPSCRLGRSQRGGAAAGLRPRPRRPGRSVQASDRYGA